MLTRERDSDSNIIHSTQCFSSAKQAQFLLEMSDAAGSSNQFSSLSVGTLQVREMSQYFDTLVLLRLRNETLEREKNGLFRADFLVKLWSQKIGSLNAGIKVL